MRRRAWICAATLAVAMGLAPEAKAVIPYDTELTPGALRGIATQPGDPWGYSYWEYLPSDFDPLDTDTLHPLVVFLAGIGEFDDDPSCPGNVDVCTPEDCGSNGLCRNLTWGPQMLIRNGNWDDELRPFIVISPQNPVPTGSTQPWSIANLDAFFDWVVANYPVDPRRMYLMGMSQGGRGTFFYTAAHPRRFAGVAPMPGGVVDLDIGCRFEDTALWVFHGENDADGNLGPGVFSPCSIVQYVHMHEQPQLYPQHATCTASIGSIRPPARMTMFHDVGHFAWVEAVDPIFEGFPASEWTSDEGCGYAVDYREYEAALDPDGVYSWFSSLDRPVVEAPADLDVLDDVGTVALTAQVTDDDPVMWQWTQIAGPAATLGDEDSDTLQVSGLVADATYTFEVLAVDADQQWDVDDVTVSVTAAPEPETSSSSGGSSSDDAGLSSTTDGSSTTDPAVPSTSDTTAAAGDSGDLPGDSDATSASNDATTGMPATDGGATAGPGPGSDPGTTVSGSATDATDDGSTSDAADSDASGGCGCRTGTNGTPLPHAALLGLLVARLRRRRRR
jgi:MYXO-CTERM domain-containing protein